MKKRSKRKASKAVSEWPDNPVVTEVRAIRKQMWKEAGGDIDKLMKIAEREARAGHPGKSSTRSRNKPAV